MASPTVRPGNGTAESVAELSCWKLVSEFGCTTLFTDATLESGTSAPELVRIGRCLRLLVDRGVEDRPALPVGLIGEDETDRDEARLAVRADRREDGASCRGHEGTLGSGQDGLVHGAQTTLAG